MWEYCYFSIASSLHIPLLEVYKLKFSKQTNKTEEERDDAKGEDYGISPTVSETSHKNASGDGILRKWHCVLSDGS